MLSQQEGAGRLAASLPFEHALDCSKIAGTGCTNGSVKGHGFSRAEKAA
jgi:hypothetical protein